MPSGPAKASPWTSRRTEIFFVLLENLAIDYFMRGVVRGRYGTGHARLHPYDVHAASDGWVVVAAPTPSSWAGLKKMIGFSATEYRRERIPPLPS